MAKKNIYATPEMEKEELQKEIDDLKSQREKLSEELREKALSATLNWISDIKNRITANKKQIDSKQKKYYKLRTPSLLE